MLVFRNVGAMFPLVVIRQPGQTPIYLSVREPIEMGRECSGFLLADPLASRRHLLLAPSGRGVIVSDLGSTNGTIVDGITLRSDVIAGAGQVIELGDTTITVMADATDESPAGQRGRSARSTVVGTGGAPAGDPDGTPAIPGEPLRVMPEPIADDLRRTSIDIVADQVRTGGVAVGALAADRGTVTLVFSDIEASIERNVALGDQVWFDVLAAHNQIVADRVEQFGGTIVENQGDGFMLAFPDARRALEAMSAVQRDLIGHSTANPDRAIRIRIGLHTGEVVADQDGDLFDQHVVVAARIANLAVGGEILVSSLAREVMIARGDIALDEPRSVNLKGIGDAVVYAFDWAHT